MLIAGHSANDVYVNAIEKLLLNSYLTLTQLSDDPNDMIAEILNVQLQIHTDCRLITIPERHFNLPYALAEAIWNVSPTDRIELLEPFNKRILEFVKDQPKSWQDHAYWAYGPWLFNGLKNVVNYLKTNPSSRRAVIAIPRILEDSMGTPPCLISLQFLIRDELVHCIVNMRSNDIWLGVPTDIFQFSFMQHIVAAGLERNVGSYYHNAGSFHLYRRDWDKAHTLFQSYTVTEDTGNFPWNLLDYAYPDFAEERWFEVFKKLDTWIDHPYFSGYASTQIFKILKTEYDKRNPRI